ncbi:MAG: efflux RND transporter permease subunit [Vampirovibrio sp.]|nr:efflux RND transporter permease subunit [Vampirovibrio sp.]
MNISEWCIKNNRTAGLFFIVVIFAGIFTFQSISKLESPEVPVRAATIITQFPGASPERVERLVTDKIEKKVREISQIDEVTSQSMTGVSIITVMLEDKYKNLQPIWTVLRNKVDEVADDLPEEALTPEVNDEYGDVFGTLFTIQGEGYSYRELKDYADDVRDALLKVDLVAKVDLYGTQQEQIFVEFSNARLAEYGVNPDSLANILSSQNIIQPSGSIQVGPERIIIEASGEYQDVEAIKNTTLASPGSSESIYLKDIAKVTRGYADPPNTMVRHNGQKAILMAVSMAKGGNIVAMTEGVKKRLTELELTMPVGITFDMMYEEAKFVENSISEFMGNLMQSFGFVVLVLLLFTGIRMGLIAGALIPLAIAGCITLLPLFNIAIEQVSIAALIIALGMMVDNGVVVSENILVRISNGQSRIDAIREASGELFIPLLAASLTTIFAFMPIATAQSAVGEFCYSMFMVITLTLICSWAFSLTAVPLMCYFFLKPQKTQQSFDGPFYTRYRNFLIQMLKKPKIFAAAILGLFVLAVFMFQFVPQVFFPAKDQETVLVDFWKPYGTDITETAESIKALETYLLDDEAVTDVGIVIGEGGPRWNLGASGEQKNDNYAFLMLETNTPEDVAAVIHRTKEFMKSAYANVRYTVQRLDSGPAVAADIQIKLSGDDLPALFAAKDRIIQLIEPLDGVTNIRDNWGEWIKKLVVDVNQEQAKRVGLTSQDVAKSLKTQMSGLVATDYREDNDAIPIRLRAKSAYRNDLGNIEGLNVYSYTQNVSVPLVQVAKTKLVWQPSSIRREDQTRTLTIETDVTEGTTATEVLEKIQKALNTYIGSEDWPAGFGVEYGGEDESSKEANESIAAGLPLAFGCLLLVLVGQFNSIRRTAIIVLTIPPMMIGITPGLLATQAPFGFMAMLGLISLMGIIVNNAIMLIDRIETERKDGLEVEEAIVSAAQQRLRPIVMTATTTIIGLIPLALQGGEMWRPMANTIIFGLAFATVLTLVLCPVLYALFFGANFSRWAVEEAPVETDPEIELG